MNHSSKVIRDHNNYIKGGSFESIDVTNVYRNVLARLTEGSDLRDKTEIIRTEFSPYFARIWLQLKKNVCVWCVVSFAEDSCRLTTIHQIINPRKQDAPYLCQIYLSNLLRHPLGVVTRIG